MSYEPIRKVASDEPLVDQPAVDAPAALPPVDLAADAEVVLAAIHRIEKAIYEGHATPPMQRMGREIAELAADIAEARLSFELDREYGTRVTAIDALLGRLERRVASMQAISFEPKAKTSAVDNRYEATRESDAEPVPTVSQVVSLLGQTDEWGTADAEPYEPPAGRPPSFAMLEAMVEALTVAPAPPPPTTPAASDEETEPAAAAPQDHALLQDVIPNVEPVTIEPDTDEINETAADTIEAGLSAAQVEREDADTGIAEETQAPIPQAQAIAPQTVPQAQPAGLKSTEPSVQTDGDQEQAITHEPSPDEVSSAPSNIQAQEDDLLSNFARMEAMPYLPQEIGTAVIFSARNSSQDLAQDKTEPTSAQGEATTRPESMKARFAIAATTSIPAAGTLSARGLALGLENAAPTPLQQSEPADSETSSFDDADIFADEPQDDGAALRFKWPTQPDADAPSQQVAIDPFAPLRTMSRAETLALFS